MIQRNFGETEQHYAARLQAVERDRPGRLVRSANAALADRNAGAYAALAVLLRGARDA